jgi:hypothetical protein
MSTLTPTDDRAIALARQLALGLSPRNRARLIALIAQDMAAEPVSPVAPAAGTDSWAALFATMDKIAASPAQAGARSATAEATESRR